MTPRRHRGQPILALRDVTIREGRRLLFAHTGWTIRRGENWAIVGPNGSGKSTLLRALCGGLPVVAGEIEFAFASGDDDPLDRIAHVSFDDQRDLAEAFSPYQQARWNSCDIQDSPTVRQTLAGDETGPMAAFLVDAPPPRRPAHIRQVARLLGIDRLLNRRAACLSNGETRKLLIARALLRRPALLILDDPFAGLDRRALLAMRQILHRVLLTPDTAVLLATARPDDLPSSVTHILHVESRRVVAAGPRRSILPTLAFWRRPAPAPARAAKARPPRPRLAASASCLPLVELHHVRVAYGRARILDDLSWTILPGQRWALVGPNGSGKTTLLSLILADNPQAYANDVRILGRRRDEGVSIWDVKKAFGAVSPELLYHYREPTTCFRVVCSGFFDSVGLYRSCTAEQSRAARAWMARLGIGHLARRDFTALSSGQQRLVLIARALVKSPRLLVLDEPCQGLDPANGARVRDLIDTACASGDLAIIYVTHRPDELPRCIDHTLRLRGGRVVKTRGGC